MDPNEMNADRPTTSELSDLLTEQELQALMREDLYQFAVQCFLELHPGHPFLPNWHHEVIASKLEACFRGECRRLIINIPPRHLKSLFASVALPAFWLGRRPADRVVCVSYAQNLAEELAGDCRKVMGAGWYQQLFPATRISRRRDAAAEFKTTLGGSRLATSVGGVLTGRGGNVVIIDDPLKPSEALSDVQRAHVNNWFKQTLYSRLDDQKTGVIIIVMQRLHLDDLAGHVQELDEWEVLSLPAIAEEEERHEICSLGQRTVHIRKPGEFLHENRQDQEVLTRIRANTNEYEFAAQYQQSPVPLGGGMVKSDWWTFYDEAPRAWDRIIQSWDTACKASEGSDFSVGTTWGKKGGDLYLLDVYRRQVDYPDLKRAVKEQAAKHKADIILIEDKASGTALIQDLPREKVRGIKGVQPEGDKMTRLNTHLTWFEGGHVRLPRQAPWLADYRKELEQFPKGIRAFQRPHSP